MIVWRGSPQVWSLIATLLISQSGLAGVPPPGAKKSAATLNESNLICELLISGDSSAILLDGRQVLECLSTSLAESTPSHSPLKDLVCRLPFGTQIFEDVPILFTWKWQPELTGIYHNLTSRSINLVTVHIDFRGLVDIKIGATLNPTADKTLFVGLIHKLRTNRAPALIFPIHHIVPAPADESPGLHISRLDTMSADSRTALREILLDLLHP